MADTITSNKDGISIVDEDGYGLSFTENKSDGCIDFNSTQHNGIIMESFGVNKRQVREIAVKLFEMSL